MNTSYNSGIYQIRNSTNGKIYIGSSKDLHKRQLEHKKQLRKNLHHCYHLQQAYNKYGQDVFEFSTIKALPPNKHILLFFEQHYLDLFWDGGNMCYNTSKYSSSNAGYTWTEAQRSTLSKAMLGLTKSVQCKQNMSKPKTKEHREKLALLCREANKKRTGIPLSEEHKRKIGLSLVGKSKGPLKETQIKAMSGVNNYQAKLTLAQVVEIRSADLTKITKSALARIYSVSRTTIADVINYKIYK